MKNYTAVFMLFAGWFYFGSPARGETGTLLSRHPFSVCCPLQFQAETSLSHVITSQNETDSPLFYNGSMALMNGGHTVAIEGCTDSGEPVCLLLLKPLTEDQTGNALSRETGDNKRHRGQQLLAAGFFCAFGVVRALSGNAYLTALTNAFATGPAGVYLYSTSNQTFSEALSEPASFEHNAENLLPLVLYGYSVYEMLEALHAGKKEFMVHGVVIFLGSTVAHYAGKLRLVVFGLVAESSQVFYNAGLIYKKCFLPEGSKPPLEFFALFSLAFFASRWIVLPYEYYKFIRDSYLDSNEYNKNPVLSNAIAAGGMVINVLDFLLGNPDHQENAEKLFLTSTAIAQ